MILSLIDVSNAFDYALLNIQTYFINVSSLNSAVFDHRPDKLYILMLYGSCRHKTMHIYNPVNCRNLKGGITAC